MPIFSVSERRERPALLTKEVALAAAAQRLLAVTANLAALPEYSRSLLTHTIRAELPAAHLTPGEYVAIESAYGAIFMLVCLAVATVIYVRAAREPVALFCAYTLVALGCGFGFLAGLTVTNPVLNALSVILTGVAQVTGGWLFLIFPSGRFVPRWSRWCALAATVGVAAVTIPAIAKTQPAPAPPSPSVSDCSCSARAPRSTGTAGSRS